MPSQTPQPQIHLDANAILRFLRFDIPSHANAVEARLIEARSGTLTIHIHPLVLAEVVFVLESNYAQHRQKIASDLAVFIDTPGLNISEEALVRDALHRYHDTNVSFVDAFLAALSAKSSHPVFSFDRELDKFKDIRRIQKES